MEILEEKDEIFLLLFVFGIIFFLGFCSFGTLNIHLFVSRTRTEHAYMLRSAYPWRWRYDESLMNLRSQAAISFRSLLILSNHLCFNSPIHFWQNFSTFFLFDLSFVSVKFYLCFCSSFNYINF